LVLDQVMSCPLAHTPGTRVYSDFGFIALGALIEEVVGQDLHDWTQTTLFPRLGLEQATFRPIGRVGLDEQIPATGLHRPRLPASGQSELYDVPEQEERPCPGFVDDDNAFALGGIAGHAGVFASAENVAQFGWRLLEELEGAQRLGRPETLKEMLMADNGGGEPLRGLGFDHPSGPQSSVGTKMTREGPIPTFGHLGFTGCSLWIDPCRRLSVSLLTNSVFPYRENLSGIRTFRPIFHDTLIEILESD